VSMLQQAWSYNVQGDRTITEVAEDLEGGGHVLLQSPHILAFALRDLGKFDFVLL
jgi:hypothetical protein